MPKPQYGAPRRPPKPSLFDYITGSRSIPMADDGPDVTGLPTDLIEQDGKPYMRRHFVLGQHNQTGGSTARYHQILESDRADLHDHPWDFVSVILSGSYVEVTEQDEQEYGPGSVLIRTAEQMHRLIVPSRKHVWTYVTLGAPRRRWGFQTEHGWQGWREYLDAETAPDAVGQRWAL